jgi:Transposase DDE domain
MDIKDLILFDRGYPSADLMLYLQKKDIRYMMRCSSSFYKEIYKTISPDEIVTIKIDSNRASELKKQGTPLPKGTLLRFRVIKVELDNGETEILLTNTTPEEITYEESKNLYFKRWGIEVKYDELKNKWEIENFSGEKPLLIEQDFHATMLVSNLASLFEQETEDKLRNKDKKNENTRNIPSTKTF